jgi:hypothetical protein
MQKNFNFNFTEFYKLYALYFPQKESPSQEYLEWFIGFAEGNCSFQEGNGFILIQRDKNEDFLKTVQETFGFGDVHGFGYYGDEVCYVVREREALYTLIALFHRNLVLTSNRLNFMQLVAYYDYPADLYENIPEWKAPLPSFETYWLSGLIDSLGYFHCSFHTSSNKYNLYFKLQAKLTGNPKYMRVISFLFGDDILAVAHAHSIRIRISGVEATEVVSKYLEKYPLRTKKAEAFKIWNNMRIYIQKNQHRKGPTRDILSSQAKILKYYN